MKRGALAALLVLVLAGAAHGQGMLSSKHNLSVTGPGPVKAVSETQVCVFCHTPHNANPASPLWNRELPGATYTPYASGTLQAAPGQPNGYSRLCLSCHDGTIAIGKVHNLWGQSTTINMQGTGPGGVMPAGPTLIGTDLSNDHPVSFVFSSALASTDGELVDPSTLTGVIRLYEGANPGARDSVQCTTCHDPHATVNPKFLKKSFTGRVDNLCLTCHVKPGWTDSSHESATTKFFQGTTVADLSCGACHHPHTVQGAPRLLRDATGATQPAIEQTCFRCHKSTAEGGITFDLKTQFAKTGSLHRITAYSGHEPVFTKATPPEGALQSGAKHVECPDCHNPHRVRARGTAGTGGVYEGMRGIKLDGSVRDDVTVDDNLQQDEICFRCHSDTYATAVGTSVNGDPSGTIPTSNKRTEFQTSNSAFHPVAGAGRNTSQNLNDQFAWLAAAGKQPSSTSSTIRCTDCHNNEYYSGSSFRGAVSNYTSTTAQPMGPHGSTTFNLLRARVWNVLPGPSAWNSTNFDLCFHCHDVEKLFGVTTQPKDFQSGARTNYDDEESGCKSAGLCKGRGNLHWFHLVDRVSNSQPVCKDCHYNIHSNVAAPNTQYRITTTNCNTTSGTLYQTPPAPVPSHLVNFRPTVLLGIRGQPKPEWCFNTVTKVRQCFVQCHKPDGTSGGPVMDGFGYKPPQGDM